MERRPHVSSDIETVYTKHQKEASRPHEQELLELLQKLKRFFRQTYIIIDAMDEASDDTRDRLLRALLSLQVNLLLTSRLSNLSKHLPENALFIRMEALNRHDIELFISKKFQESTRLLDFLKGKEEFRKKICAEVMEKSNGMYVVFVSRVEFDTYNRIAITKVSISSPTNRILKKLYYAQPAEEGHQFPSIKPRRYVFVYVGADRNTDQGKYFSRYASHHLADICISVADDH